MRIKIDTIHNDSFVVIDAQGNPVTGLTDIDFTRNLYNPNGIEVANISAGVEVIITETGDGIYKVSFTPNLLGIWTLTVYNATHFPWGKGKVYFCVGSLFDDLKTMIDRVLGLCQENYRLFSPVYIRIKGQYCMTSAIIKIYPSSANCDADTNVLATYNVVATYNREANMTSYKVTKV